MRSLLRRLSFRRAPRLIISRPPLQAGGYCAATNILDSRSFKSRAIIMDAGELPTDDEEESMEAGYIRVLVRLRPLEHLRGKRTEGNLRVDSGSAFIEHGSQRHGPYTQVCEGISNEELFSVVGPELVASAQRGFNGTLFCYGQTGRSAAAYNIVSHTHENTHTRARASAHTREDMRRHENVTTQSSPAR